MMRSVRSVLAAAVGVLAAVVVTTGCAAAGTGASASGSSASGSSESGASASASVGSPSATANDDPAAFAPQVDRYARQAGIDSQLLMAILYNESYKPHDPAFERAWHSLEPDSAFGVANMHQKAFNDTKRGRDFAGRRWEELPDDPALAIEAAAWYLHDLAVRLPTSWTADYTKNELLALGYNAGPGNMMAFARGGALLPLARTYLQKLHENWDAAAAALRRGR
jgi:soluble lytic murein transglycosylase-like protein